MLHSQGDGVRVQHVAHLNSKQTDYRVERKNRTKSVTPAVTLVLLALADRPRHGYGIRSEIEKFTAGHTKMGSGTFYRSIQRMMVGGWVRRLDHLADADNEDERRIYYELTDLGRETAATEARRLAELVGVAISRRLLPGYHIDVPAEQTRTAKNSEGAKR